MDFAPDKITLIKSKTGQKIFGINSLVDENLLIIQDDENTHVEYNIESGDYIQREARGVIELYKILEPNYYAGAPLGGYQSKILLVTEMDNEKSVSPKSNIVILCLSADPQNEIRRRQGEELRAIHRLSVKPPNLVIQLIPTHRMNWAVEDWKSA